MDKELCPICRSGPIGFKFTRDFHTKPNVTLEDLARHFDMDKEDVIEHINHHEMQIMTKNVNGIDKTVISSPDFYLNEFGFMYGTLKDLLQEVIDQRDADGNVDSILIDQITKLTKEMNNSLTKLGEFQGRLKNAGDSETKILQVEGNLNIITDILSGGCLCDKCQPRVMKKLDSVMHLLK